MEPLEWAIVEIIIAVALSYAAGRLLAKKAKGPINDEVPVTLATRGAYTNWLIGVRRLGPLFCAIGQPFDHKERAPHSTGGFFGGLLGSNSKVSVRYQTGMHVICSGPVDELRAIYQEGNLLFKGPISRAQYPSGSSFSLGKEGSFTIWWGDEESLTGSTASPDTGIDAVTGINSRWPMFCRIDWFNKHLGTGTTWPTLEYEVYKKCLYSDALLPSTDSAIPNTFGALSGSLYNVVHLTPGPEGTGYIEIDAGIVNYSSGDGLKYPHSVLQEGDKFQLAGNTYYGTDIDFEVLRVDLIHPSLGDTTDDTYHDDTFGNLRPRIFVKGADLDHLGISADGTVQRYIRGSDDGLNAAHVVAELLFAPWPVGLGLPSEFYNVNSGGNSLDALGVICDTELLSSSLVSTDGQTAKDLLNGALADIGAFMVLNPVTGLIDFMPLRPDQTPIEITAEKLGDTFPEIETPVGELPTDRVVFAFSDRGIGFRDRTVAVSADGQAAYEDNQSAQRVVMESVIDYAVAARVADRRSQESLSTGSAMKFSASHDTRVLVPGQVVTVPSITTNVRLTSVNPQSETGKVEFEAIADFLSVQQTGLTGDGGNPGTVVDDPEPPLQFDIVQLDASTIMVPFIRDNVTVSTTTFYISTDNVTYYDIASYGIAAAGGTTTTAMLVGDTTGPQFTMLGPDSGNLLDLSSDTDSFNAGRQLLMIHSSAGVEICYVDLVDITLGSTPNWQIHNIVRAQFGTTAYAHPIGARVYIFAQEDGPTLQDVTIKSGATIYVKPVSAGNALNQTTAKSITLV